MLHSIYIEMHCFLYLIKIELRHDSLERISDTRDVLAQNVLEQDGNHKYHSAGFHFDTDFLP